MFNNLDKLMSSPASAGDRSDDGEVKLSGNRNHGNAMYSSSDYMRSEELDMTRPNFHKNFERTSSAAKRTPVKPERSLTAEPPKYDDIVPLMSDDE